MIFASYGHDDCHCGGSCGPCGAVAGYGGYGSFGGSWEDFCSAEFASDPKNLAKCMSKPSSVCPFGICLPGTEPWSAQGAAARGIPLVARGTAVARRQAGAAAVVAEKQTGIMTAAAIAGGAGFLLLVGGALLRRARPTGRGARR